MNGSTSKTSLFLMELILMILFFALSAAVCLRIFAGAQVMSDGSRDLSCAVLETECAAECFKAAGGDISKAAAAFGAAADGSGFSMEYDADWGRTEGEGVYRLTLAADDGTADIGVVRCADGASVFALRVKAVG